MSDTFQLGLRYGAFIILQLLVINSQEFFTFEVWTVSRPTWKHLDAIVNASFSGRGAPEYHSPSIGVFHNLLNSKMQFFRHFALEVVTLFCLSFLNEQT